MCRNAFGNVPTIEKPNLRLVGCASRGEWDELLQGGVEIHEYQPTMFHCKMLIVDRLLVSVGSTNFDERSFRLNDEANLNIFDAAFAQSLTTVFEADLAQSHQISMKEWEERPLTDRVTEYLSDRISTLL